MALCNDLFVIKPPPSIPFSPDRYIQLFLKHFEEHAIYHVVISWLIADHLWKWFIGNLGMLHKEFGALLAQVRKDNGLTQEKLSENSKVAVRYIQNLEAGESLPTLEMLFKLSKGLGTSPDQLILPVWDSWQG